MEINIPPSSHPHSAALTATEPKLKRSPHLAAMRSYSSNSNERYLLVVVAPPATAATGGDCNMQSSPSSGHSEGMLVGSKRNSHKLSDFFELKRPSIGSSWNSSAPTNATTAHKCSSSFPYQHQQLSSIFTSENSSTKNSCGRGGGGVGGQYYHIGGGKVRPHHGPSTRRPLPKSRRKLTVSAGLAYGRIPDWHVRSILSKV